MAANGATAGALLEELAELLSNVQQTTRAVVVSAQVVDLTTSGEGGLLMNSVLGEAEKVAVMMARMNQVTRELRALHEARPGSVPVDFDTVREQNETAARCLQEIFKLIPHPDDTVNEDEFIEEFDKLLANEEETSRRHRYLERMRNIWIMSRDTAGAPGTGGAAAAAAAAGNATSGASTSAGASAATSSSMSTKKILTAVVLPLAGGVLGGLIFGPAGLLLGFKGATMLGACAAVGAGVGITAGAGVQMLRPHTQTTGTANATANANPASSSSPPPQTPK